MVTGTIEIVAALIRDDAGQVLLVRKRGTTAFMQPGGKRDSGEDDIAALYEIDVIGDIAPKAEIDAMVWIDPAASRDTPLAPLRRDHVLPLASRERVQARPDGLLGGEGDN